MKKLLIESLILINLSFFSNFIIIIVIKYFSHWIIVNIELIVEFNESEIISQILMIIYKTSKIVNDIE